jgi:hypothetical protein
MPHQQLSVPKSLAGTKNQTSIYTIDTIVVGSKHTEDKISIKQHSLSHATAKTLLKTGN